MVDELVAGRVDRTRALALLHVDHPILVVDRAVAVADGHAGDLDGALLGADADAVVGALGATEIDALRFLGEVDVLRCEGQQGLVTLLGLGHRENASRRDGHGDHYQPTKHEKLPF